jgi:hypothetical protein
VCGLCARDCSHPEAVNLHCPMGSSPVCLVSTASTAAAAGPSCGWCCIFIVQRSWPFSPLFQLPHKALGERLRGGGLFFFRMVGALPNFDPVWSMHYVPAVVRASDIAPAPAMGYSVRPRMYMHTHDRKLYRFLAPSLVTAAAWLQDLPLSTNDYIYTREYFIVYNSRDIDLK